MKLTYKAILDDPSLLERTQRQAHRERAQAMHRLIVVPITRLFSDFSFHKEEACTTTSA